MLKARAGGLLVVGLSEENIRRLQADQPIYFETNAVGFTGNEHIERILIFAGKDEQDMRAQIEEFITPATLIRDSSRKPTGNHNGT